MVYEIYNFDNAIESQFDRIHYESGSSVKNKAQVCGLFLKSGSYFGYGWT